MKVVGVSGMEFVQGFGDILADMVYYIGRMYKDYSLWVWVFGNI